MKHRRTALIGAGLTVLIAATIFTVLVVRAVRESPADRGRKVALALSAGLGAAVERAADLREPYRCARLDGRPGDESDGRVVKHADRRYELRGHTLEVTPADDRLVVGVVADARGARAPTLAHASRLRRELADAGVELVVSLGGMGRDRAELAGVLGALAEDADWALVAIPGDREALPAHRDAIAEVDGETTNPVFDGSQVRFIEFDGAVIATFPGVGEPAQLVAGDHGCTHTAADAEALAEALAARDGVRVWAGHAPPRQDGLDASDVVRGGIHIGERELAAALPDSGAALVLHGLVDEAVNGPPQGRHATRAESAAVVATGALEALPHPTEHRTIASSVLLATITSERIRWRRLVARRGD